MIRVELTGCGQHWQLDAPDATFIGPWLKAIFDQVPLRPRMMVDFVIRIS